MKPRLKHVADHAGVSQATVSRVLNGKPGVAEETRQAVERAIAQLGYEHGRLRQARRTGLVGLIVPELDNPVFPRFAQAIESRLASEDLTTLLCTSTPAGMGESEYLDVLLDHQVTGIVIISGHHVDLSADDDAYRRLGQLGIPLVLVNGRDAELPVAAVTVDHREVTKLAVAHLASLGHERIGLALGPRRYLTADHLLEGYRTGLEIAGLPYRDELVEDTLYGIEGGHACGGRLLQRGATAVTCASDRMALGVIRAARELGLEVPDDISVIGFDDAGPNAFVDPPLTSVQQPFEAMAAAIVQLLTDQIAGWASTTELTFRPQLVVRGSTATAVPNPYPVEDGSVADEAATDEAATDDQQPSAAPSARGSVATA
ncbi:MAG: LacI family DNA-binding transcriptional regulator [Nitriliruptoraceae bacterium]|nr:LacI family DNA-binding transcriptional regulator [Nitriliruptoraceae bacterium]